MNLEEELQIKLFCSIDKAAIKCVLPPDGAEERGLEKEFREIIGHAIEPIFKEFASSNATLKAGLETAIKCGDVQRDKLEKARQAIRLAGFALRGSKAVPLAFETLMTALKEIYDE